MSGWVNLGVSEYVKRMPRSMPLTIIEVPSVHRPGDGQSKRLEGIQLLKKVGVDDLVVALDIEGKQTDSLGLGKLFEHWSSLGRDVSFLIGGADGLDDDCLQRADKRMSLSALTLPHGIARLVLAEQLYRAWSIQVGHPYHTGH